MAGDDLETEVARLRDALEAERRVSEQWRRVAEERRVAMERLRQRRVVRILFAVAKVLLPVVRRWRARTLAVERRLRGFASGILGARHRLTAGRREATLRRAVASLPEPDADPRRVAAIVLTHDGLDHLTRLLPRLRSVSHPSLDIVVVDNASGPDTGAWLDAQSGITVIRNDANLSYAEAYNRAVATVTADVVLLLNDDVEPIDDDWLARMLARLDGNVAAVGAQLVYPRRSLLDGRTRDVSIQHLGIALEPDGDGPPRAVNRGHGMDPDPRQPVEEVAGATGACLLVDRSAFLDAGGFDVGYEYGAEDVDLCWRLRTSGHRVLIEPAAVLWHREGATRHRQDMAGRAERQRRNWDRLIDRFGPAMRRAVEQDRLTGQLVLSDRPFQVGITVTRDLETAGYGDWYTAHELGAAMGELGWRVRYVERYRDAWYDTTEGLDLVVVLHDEFDLRRVARPGLTSVAWIRNWADRWVGHPWFDDFDVVTASSRVVADEIVATSRREAVPVVPLATNPSRFTPGTGSRRGAVLTVNNWGVDRGVESLLAASEDLQLYGKGWEDVPSVAGHWHGHLSYEDLPALYAGAQVVVDQASPHTRPFGSVNSRVFDALSAGALVLTDQVEGAEEIFGGLLPTWSNPEDVPRLLREFRDDPSGTQARVAALQRLVWDEHTYSHRAATFRDLVADHLARPTFVIRIGAPNRREARSWGDTYFAEGLVTELRAAGHRALIQTLDEWNDREGRGYDVSLHLKGRSRCPRSVGQLHVVWIISHPDEVDPGELAVADVVFVASELLASRLRSMLDGVPVHVLLQATDERRFRPRTPDPSTSHDVVFVGNSRFSERPMVMAAAAADVGLAVYGANWERYLPPDVVRDRFVPNEDVPVVYTSSAVVLNDHWDDMRRWGLISNRVFDALACGACVVSDDVYGLKEVLGDAVATTGPETLVPVLRELLADHERRARMGRHGRQLVLAKHTFRHRVQEMCRILLPLRDSASGSGTVRADTHDASPEACPRS